MAITIDKLIRKPVRLFGVPIDLEPHAIEKNMLCAAEPADVMPAIYLPGHFDRIKSTNTGTDLSLAYAHAHETHTVHGETVLYNLGEVRMWNGLILQHMRNFILRRVNSQDHFETIDLDCALIADTDEGHEYFGHWLRDDTTSSLIGNANMPPIFMQSIKYGHAPEYDKLMDICVLFANNGRVKNLHLLRDFSQNSHRVGRYLTMRQRIQEKLQPKPSRFAGVFVARGAMGAKRNLTNESEVIEHLAKRGFDIIYPERMTASEIQIRLWDTPMVVCVEGSAHMHALRPMALQGALLHLQPPNRFVDIDKGVFNSIGRQYGFYVCAPDKTPQDFFLDNFSDFDKLIDLMRDACDKSPVRA
jgi:Glycosyltransferase 61